MILTFLPLLSCIAVCISTHLVSLPTIARLKKIYSIESAHDVEIVSRFSRYQDVEVYGARPYCLDNSHLQALNTTFDWNNPDSFGIKNTKNLYIAKAKKAFIAPSFLGTIFDNTQQLLFEITLNPGCPIFWPVESTITSLPILSYKKLASVQGPTYYYHWVIDRLPSIFLLKDIMIQDPQIKLVLSNVNGAAATFVREYLDLLGIPEDQCIFASNSHLYRAEEIYFATPFLMEPIPKKLLLAVRDALIRAAFRRPTSRQYNDNLIVIIQRKEANRKIANLQALIDLVASLFSDKNYEILTFDASTSISEQIQIFNNAKIIIGVMASGLTNILYAKSDSYVIEIHPDFDSIDACTNKSGIINHGCEWAWWLSSVVGSHYWILPTPYQLSDYSLTCPLKEMKKVLENIALTI